MASSHDAAAHCLPLPVPHIACTRPRPVCFPSEMPPEGKVGAAARKAAPAPAHVQYGSMQYGRCRAAVTKLLLLPCRSAAAQSSPACSLAPPAGGRQPGVHPGRQHQPRAGDLAAPAHR